MKVSIQEDMWEVMQKLPGGQGARLAEALIAYGFTGTEPDACADAWYFAFLAFRSRIELSAKQSAGGDAGNARRWTKADRAAPEAAHGTYIGPESVSEDTDNRSVAHTDNRCQACTDNRSEADTESRYAQDTDDPESEKESEKERKDNARAGVREATQEVVGHLNAVCGTSYRASSAATQRLVSGRLGEGYSAADMCSVIDCKAAQWLHDRRMRAYLRPETLFAASKFEGYLQEAQAPRSRARPMEAYDRVAEVVGG